MSVTTTGNRRTYTGNGVTTVFAFPYLFPANTDIVVIVDGVTQTVGFTVTGAADPNGGNVTFLVAPAVGAPIILYRDPDLLQQTVLSPNDPFPAKTVERMSDKLTLIAQRINEVIQRSFRLSDADSSTASVTVPTPVANNLIGWNSSASGLQNVDPTSFAGIVAYGNFSWQSFSGDGVTTDFVLSSDPISTGNIDCAVGGVVQRAALDYNIVAALTIRITPAPPVGVNNVFFRWGSALPIGVASAITGQTTIGTQLITAPTAAAARTVIGAASSGANSDITSLSGLTTLITVSQGGTGSVTGPITPNYLSGLTLSTAGSSTTMSIAAGITADIVAAAMLRLATAYAKTTAAWAVGTGNGGKLSAAAIANATWYYWYIIRRPDTGVVDIGFDVSATAPTLPANYTQYRRIGASLTNGSAQWVKFTQIDDEFYWDVPTLDLSNAGVVTAQSLTLNVPRLRVKALLNVAMQYTTGTNGGALLSDLAIADTAPSANVAPLITIQTGSTSAASGVQASVWTNTSAQIRYRSLTTGANLYIATTGWIDLRGRDA